MNIQALIYGFAGLSGFTLITIGAWQSNEWLVGTGVSLLTYIMGKYTDAATNAIKRFKK
jgi:hypothetical protein